MMRMFLILSAWLAMGAVGFSQNADKNPLGAYEELADPKPHDDDAVWEKMKNPTELSWGTIDVRYAKHDVPDVKPAASLRLKAWRGERVNAQAVLWTRTKLGEVKLCLGELRSATAALPADAGRAHFVRYVMTDELNKERNGGCGDRSNKADWDSSLVADVLDIVPARTVEARTVQPLWVNVWVPAGAKPGVYKGKLTVEGENLRPVSLSLEIEVLDRTLPAPKDWGFHLDLWQNPYAVARYYQVPLWSKAHFDAMRPIMKMLADAGQRTVTASIMYQPWAGQTEDHFDSMITRIKRIDGTWTYDYAVFDKWVGFMRDDIGITGLISCYTMIPWALKFDYYDEATNRVRFVEAKPGDAAYAEYWGTFLKDFARHLREKGWFEHTAISMDERPMESMREAIKVIRQADPTFKITLAGNYHPEIQADLYYLSIPYGQTFPAEAKAERERRGQLSTVYTCCTEAFPNTFTFSAPAEAAWTAIHALAGGYDGYLRWAVNSWTADPLRDSRFRTWAAGDTYSIYPGPRSSIRFERLVEGLQDCEKIRLLRKELKGKSLRRLNEAVGQFTPQGFIEGNRTAAEMVGRLNELINSF